MDTRTHTLAPCSRGPRANAVISTPQEQTSDSACLAVCVCVSERESVCAWTTAQQPKDSQFQSDVPSSPCSHTWSTLSGLFLTFLPVRGNYSTHTSATIRNFALAFIWKISGSSEGAFRLNAMPICVIFIHIGPLVFLMLCFMHQQCKSLAVAKANKNVLCLWRVCLCMHVLLWLRLKKITRNCICLSSFITESPTAQEKQETFFNQNDTFPTCADTSVPELVPVRMNQHKLTSHHWLCTKSQVDKASLAPKP